MDPDLPARFQKAKDALEQAERAINERPQSSESHVLSILLRQEVEVVPYLCHGLARRLKAWPINTIRGIPLWNTQDVERLAADVAVHDLRLTVKEIHDWAERAVKCIQQQSGADMQKFANFMLGDTLS